MTVIRQCECCNGDGSEGKEWFIGTEGEDICARCAAELLGAERDALRQQLQGAVVIDDAAIIRAANAIGQLGTDRIGAEPYAAARAILDAARGQ
jgi:hypothetical protein